MGLLLPGKTIALFQKKAAKTLREFERRGLLVPPVMIVRITSCCNLTCAECSMKINESSFFRNRTFNPGRRKTGYAFKHWQNFFSRKKVEHVSSIQVLLFPF
jgi:hypothetical protein